MQQQRFTGLGGGLDLVTPPIARDPGRAIGGYNYEPRPEGYARMRGIERFDGRGLPSAATYWHLPFTNGTAALTAGDILVGGTSGATAVALSDAVLVSGSFEEGDASGYVVIGELTDAFEAAEDIEVSSVARAVATDGASLRPALSDSEDITKKLAAEAYRRSLIQKVPGTGPVRGIGMLSGVAYAWRNNVDETACVMHRATATGWQEVDLGARLDFTSAGTYEIAEGDVIEGATSGATATVKRVVVQDGSFSGGDAEGYLVVYTQTGTFEAENIDVGANTNVATIAADSVAHSFAPSGRFKLRYHNFYGGSGTRRMYGCDGVSPAFEFDGTTYCPIDTGSPVDTPTHIACHKDYLFLAFAGGSIQNSVAGEPLSWNGILGASERGLGDEVTGLIANYYGTLVALGRNRLAIIYGSVFGPIDGADDYMETISLEVGALNHTLQAVPEAIWLDDAGIRTLAAVQSFGNFQSSLRSQLIAPFLDRKRLEGKTVIASMSVRRRSQLRLFYDDGTGIIMDMTGRNPAAMPMKLPMNAFTTASVEDASGDEVLLIGATDGYVYRMDSGNSFDGDPLEAMLRLSFNHLGSPTNNKRLHAITMEGTAPDGVNLNLIVEPSYGDQNNPALVGESFEIMGRGGFWGEDSWQEFYWAPIEGRKKTWLAGQGFNFSVAFLSESMWQEPHVVHGLIFHYSLRGPAN